MDPVYGGSIDVEFASRSRVRPLLDFSALRMPVSQFTGVFSSVSRKNQYSSLTGLRWYPARTLSGIHFDLLWGIHLNDLVRSQNYFVHPDSIVVETVKELDPALTLAAGMGIVAGPVAFSVRYQIEPDYTPWDAPEQWTGKDGFAVFRLGFVLGGALRPFADTPEKPLAPSKGSRTGSKKMRLAWQTARADSLERLAEARDTTLGRLMDQADSLQAELDRQQAMAARFRTAADSLRTATDSIRARPAPRPVPVYSVLHENPYRFHAVAVYTVLHPFSDPLRSDTFRVVTTIPPGGGYKHELQIATVKGNLYKEEFYALPLPGVTPGPTADEERELLRVRMALAPDVFLPDPVTDAVLALSEAREARDLVFQLSKAQFTQVLQDHPAVGFRFQSDERTTKVLVYSPTLDRIVNIQSE
ncbi:MAG: hypothetical protein KDC01_08300 [Flavobacteriales bacterium]|jgi:hypothetical protein|nr:hypothetical protein [Flavobacteriales bacterium]